MPCETYKASLPIEDKHGTKEALANRSVCKFCAPFSKRTLEKQLSLSSKECSASFTPAQHSSPAPSVREVAASSHLGSVPRESRRCTLESSLGRKPSSRSSSSSSSRHGAVSADCPQEDILSIVTFEKVGEQEPFEDMQLSSHCRQSLFSQSRGPLQSCKCPGYSGETSRFLTMNLPSLPYPPQFTQIFSLRASLPGTIRQQLLLFPGRWVPYKGA
ncbi:UNVERIFIED_CONTAM: hypothetical protein FKN15_050078 [Acipenser sinensis]